jgi:hypothetical protein
MDRGVGGGVGGVGAPSERLSEAFASFLSSAGLSNVPTWKPEIIIGNHAHDGPISGDVAGGRVTWRADGALRG